MAGACGVAVFGAAEEVCTITGFGAAWAIGVAAESVSDAGVDVDVGSETGTEAVAAVVTGIGVGAGTGVSTMSAGIGCSVTKTFDVA